MSLSLQFKIRRKRGKTNSSEKIYRKNNWTSWKFCVIFGESNGKTFYFRSKSHFSINTKKAWLFFVSNKLQESKNTDVLGSLSTDHSSISFILRKSQIIAKGKGLWIFKSSLTLNKEFVEKMKGYISICLNHLEKENILDDQVRTEYLKYKVKKIFKNASKET